MVKFSSCNPYKQISLILQRDPKDKGGALVSRLRCYLTHQAWAANGTAENAEAAQRQAAQSHWVVT